jgi:hypothetical protein
MIDYWLSAHFPGDAIFWQAMRLDLLHVVLILKVFGENWTIYTMNIDVLAGPTVASQYRRRPLG